MKARRSPSRTIWSRDPSSVSQGSTSPTAEISGRFRIGTVTGTFQSRIRLSNQAICYTAEDSPEECNTVYISGQDVFEVAHDGSVVTVIFLQ